MKTLSKELIEKIKKIKMFIMDVDGTLTDGKIYLGNDGEEFKAFNVKDGLGIKLLQKNNITPVIITGRHSVIVNIRAKELDIKEVYQGIDDKLEIYNKIKKKSELKDKQIGFIGDDLNDLSIMKAAGVSFGVNDCVIKVKNYCDYITDKNGGDGAIREIADIILNII